MESGSPFGHSIAAMVVYLHYVHAIGMERLTRLMDELFALSISEGAISNIPAPARQSRLDATATIETVVLASPEVWSDETSVRVKGKNWREVQRTPLGTVNGAPNRGGVSNCQKTEFRNTDVVRTTR